MYRKKKGKKEVGKINSYSKNSNLSLEEKIKKKTEHQLTKDIRNKIKEFKKQTELLGWNNYIENLLKGTQEIINCELANGAKKRANILKLEKLAEKYAKVEEHFHNRSMNNFKEGVVEFKKSRTKIDRKEIEKIEKAIRDEKNLNWLRTEVFDTLKQELVEQIIPEETTIEITELYNEIIEDVVATKGFEGLLDYISEKQNELILKRSEKERGRQPHSPWDWWEWLLYGLWIGASVVAVIILAAYGSWGWAVLCGVSAIVAYDLMSRGF